MEKTLNMVNNPVNNLKQALVDMQEMRKSKAPKKTWRELKAELKQDR